MNNNLFTNETHNEFNTNCLALAIRKDYRLTIVQNALHTVKRVSFKVLVNFGMLNFLNIIF